jgi:hypothetical protein
LRVRGWTGNTTGSSRDLAETLDDLRQQRTVHERGTVQRDQQVVARLDAQARCGRSSAKPRLDGHEAVDHRVAHEVHALVLDPLAAQVLDRLVAVQEQHVRELVGDDPVDLLGHAAVEAPEPRLEVGDRQAHLGRDERHRQRRVHVARNDDQVGPLLLEDRLDPLHHARRLNGVTPGSDAEHVVRRGDAELLEEDVRHHPVVVLTGVDEEMLSVRKALAELCDYRRRLDEVRSRPDHGESSHRAECTRRMAIWLAVGAQRRWRRGA